MREEYLDLNLTENCHCVSEYGHADSYCYNCDGDGEVLTDEGRKLLRFMRKYLFKEISE